MKNTMQAKLILCFLTLGSGTSTINGMQKVTRQPSLLSRIWTQMPTASGVARTVFVQPAQKLMIQPVNAFFDSKWSYIAPAAFLLVDRGYGAVFGAKSWALSRTIGRWTSIGMLAYSFLKTKNDISQIRNHVEQMHEKIDQQKSSLDTILENQNTHSQKFEDIKQQITTSEISITQSITGKYKELCEKLEKSCCDNKQVSDNNTKASINNQNAWGLISHLSQSEKKNFIDMDLQQYLKNMVSPECFDELQKIQNTLRSFYSISTAKK